jgi:hypothetical protein
MPCAIEQSHSTTHDDEATRDAMSSSRSARIPYVARQSFIAAVVLVNLLQPTATVAGDTWRARIRNAGIRPAALAIDTKGSVFATVQTTDGASQGGLPS